MDPIRFGAARRQQSLLINLKNRQQRKQQTQINNSFHIDQFRKNMKLYIYLLPSMVTYSYLLGLTEAKNLRNSDAIDSGLLENSNTSVLKESRKLSGSTCWLDERVASCRQRCNDVLAGRENKGERINCRAECGDHLCRPCGWSHTEVRACKDYCDRKHNGGRNYWDRIDCRDECHTRLDEC